MVGANLCNVDHGYVVHAPDDDCKESVSRARSKAICALAARGIVLSDKRTWPRSHPAQNHYSNREGAQVAVVANVDQGSEGDVVVCHSVLKRLHEKSELTGSCLRNVHVRFPNGDKWNPPSLGWHVERGAGSGLNCTCIVHFTTVPVGGGGVAVVVGSHKFVKRGVLVACVPGVPQGVVLLPRAFGIFRLLGSALWAVGNPRSRGCRRGGSSKWTHIWCTRHRAMSARTRESRVRSERSTLGWHVERGAGSGLNCTCIVQFTSVPVGGGGGLGRGRVLAGRDWLTRTLSV